MDIFSLSAKITLDKSEYEKGLSDAEKEAKGAADGISGSTDKASTSFSKLGRALDVLKHPIKTYSEYLKESKETQRENSEMLDIAKKKYSALQDDIKSVTKEYLNSAKATGEDSEETKSLHEQLSKLKSQSNSAEKEVAELSKELDNGSEKSDKFKGVLSGLGKGLATVGKGLAIGMGAATTATVAFVKKSVAEYAEYQQLWGGVQKLYGAAGASFEEYVAKSGYSMDKLNNSDEAHLGILRELQEEYNHLKYAEGLMAENAKKAFKTAGMSANEYMEVATSFSAALINSLGGDTVEAARLTDLAMTSISDNVNTFGSDMDSVQRAFQGFAKQNYTMLDNLKLGYGGTKSEMERLIEDANEYAKSIGEAGDLSIDSFADIVKAIDLVQKKQGIYGTTANEGMKTISGSINMLKGAWANLVAGISNPDADVGQLINDVLESGKAVLENLLPTIKQATSGIVQLVRDIAPMITEELPELVEELLPPILEVATELLNGLIEALPTFIAVLVEQIPPILNSIVTKFLELLPQIVQLGLTLITSLAQGIAESLPSLIPTIIDVLLQIIDTLTNPDNLMMLVDAAIEIILALATGLIDALPKLIDKLPDIIINIVEALIRLAPKLIEAGIELILKLAVGLIKAIPQLILKIPEIILSIVNALLKGGKQLLDTGKKLVGFVKDGILNIGKKAKDWGKDLISNFIGGIKAKFNKLKETVTGIASTIKGFLGFSEPDEGPLSNFHTYAPDMIDLFVKGIKDNQKKLDEAITNAFDFKPMITGGAEIGLPNPNSQYADRMSDFGGTTINVYAAKNQDVNELAEIIGRKLNKGIRRNQEVWA